MDDSDIKEKAQPSNVVAMEKRSVKIAPKPEKAEDTATRILQDSAWSMEMKWDKLEAEGVTQEILQAALNSVYKIDLDVVINCLTIWMLEDEKGNASRLALAIGKAIRGLTDKTKPESIEFTITFKPKISGVKANEIKSRFPPLKLNFGTVYTASLVTADVSSAIGSGEDSESSYPISWCLEFGDLDAPKTEAAKPA